MLKNFFRHVFKIVIYSTFLYSKALSLSYAKSKRKFLTFLARDDHSIFACGNLQKNLYCF